MTPYIVLGIAIVALSAVVAYCWWAHFRVWVLRQDLFEIRDRLWDVARAKGYLENPEYVKVREQLNALIRLAPCISVWTWRHLHKSIAASESTVRPTYTIPEVHAAMRAAAHTVNRYIFLRSISGFLYLMFQVFRHRKVTQQQEERKMERETERIVVSRKLRDLDRTYQQSMAGYGVAIA